MRDKFSDLPSENLINTCWVAGVVTGPKPLRTMNDNIPVIQFKDFKGSSCRGYEFLHDSISAINPIPR